MKVFTSGQIKDWDNFTIQYEPIAPIDLMERAATVCTQWLQQTFTNNQHFTIFCGMGNNGGDGLAIARLLSDNGCVVAVHILQTDKEGSQDFKQNLERLKLLYPNIIHYIQQPEDLPLIATDSIIIDAILGTGTNRPVTGITAALFDYLNSLTNTIVAIDMPSGLYADAPTKNSTCIHATHTLSLQTYKRALLMADNAKATGEVHILPIGLHPDYYNNTATHFDIIDAALIKNIYKPRKLFAHKGTYGHGLLIAGSHGKSGAAVLSAKAALRSGIGLLTCYTVAGGYNILQTTVPEAMTITDEGRLHITNLQLNTDAYSAIGIGPGLGTHPQTIKAFYQLLHQYKKPMVIDADALNILAQQPDWYTSIPANSILTPHPKEFERLFGNTDNNFAQQELALQKAISLQCFIVVKGRHSFMATPNGKGFYNSTGNAGMATAGSGDVLTGILTSLLAQGYTPEHAAILGVYLHGLSGDYAAKNLSMEAMNAGDIINYLPQAFKQVAAQ